MPEPEIQDDAMQEIDESQEDFELQYRQMLKEQLELDLKQADMQRQQQAKQFNEIKYNVEQLKQTWTNKNINIPKPVLNAHQQFIQKYESLRSSKSKRTILGEALYKTHKDLQ